MAKQFFVIFGCLALGEVVVWAKLSQFLLANLGFFFVPPGVAIMLYLDVIQKELLPIAMATILSTILVLVVTGHMHQFVVKAERKIIAMNMRRKRKEKLEEQDE